MRINKKWQYICVFIDLFNRKLNGYSVGPHKNALIVYRAITSIKTHLFKIKLLQIDHGSEFKNKLINVALATSNIQSSLSMKECYDNAVEEVTFKVIKTKFIRGRHFDCLEGNLRLSKPNRIQT